MAYTVSVMQKNCIFLYFQ